MKLAATFEDGYVFGHFGHTEAFKIYEIAEGKVHSAQVIPTNGSGHGALAGFLKELGVHALICGGMGMGARMALAEAGIVVYAGVTGLADDAVACFLSGGLSYTSEATCDHHHDGEDHTCGSHGCGSDHACGGHCGH